MSILKDFASRYADANSESEYGHMRTESAFIAGAKWIAENIKGRIKLAELNGRSLPATMVNNFIDDLMTANIRVKIGNQGSTPIDERKLTVHVDYANGIPYTEAENAVPNTYLQYSDYPINCYISDVCDVITKDGERKTAVFASAYSVHLNNDGTHSQWEGWVEWYKSETCAYVEDLYNDKTLDVVRWHYKKW